WAPASPPALCCPLHSDNLWPGIPLTRMPHGLDSAFGWRTEEAAVLAAELRGALVADFKRCARRVQVLVEHQAPGFAQSQPFLVLQGALCSECPARCSTWCCQLRRWRKV